MVTAKRTIGAIAAMELLLVLPGALFMTALFVRQLQPPQHEPAYTAQRIVGWFVGLGPRVGLWGLLMALPLAVLVIGCATLRRRWTDESELRTAALQTLAAARTHLAALCIALATLTAGCILAIVALHSISD